MRLLFFILGISVGIVGTGDRAAAQNYPWCAQYSGDGGMNCGFTTFQQCLADVSGIGGFCTQNSTYQPSTELRSSARVQRRYPY
jgi:Protein of unknown function (DUF3551)